ncbi:Aste57867_23555 [Aphanomyces stellatus]|uniref:Aste57867_23555 protein n=1 Tax=Aphanomyces stellatus TaxID=120398 RepID=A0A485LN49_9STRA|nr:hypothetical protein As57867_023484 [Aphanomyces stellatus]VFU00200.1 Aste57867_23555 [Aphanomyces stellatus]
MLFLLPGYDADDHPTGTSVSPSMYAATGGMRSLIVTNFVASFYAPVGILLDVVHRHKAAIKFVQSRSFSDTMLVSLVGYVVAEMRIVLTFHLTEMMVDRASKLPILVNHTFVWFHILVHLRDSFRFKHSDPAALHGTAGVLDAFLQTSDGFHAFSTFAKAEFMFACVVAWKTFVEYRLQSPGHLSVSEIYDQHLAASAVSSVILKRYTIVIQGNDKYIEASEDENVYDASFFDGLHDATLENLWGRYSPASIAMRWALDGHLLDRTYTSLVAAVANEMHMPAMGHVSLMGSHLPPILSSGLYSVHMASDKEDSNEEPQVVANCASMAGNP